MPPSFAPPPSRRGPFSALARRILALWDRGSIRLGDAQASLHAARHHLVQALAFSLWQRDELLTARGHQPELERTTAAIYRALAHSLSSAGAAEGPRDAETRDLLARLRWLQPSAFARPDEARPRRRRGALLLALAAALTWLGLAVADALTFHSTYERRLDSAAAPASPEERSQDHGH